MTVEAPMKEISTDFHLTVKRGRKHKGTAKMQVVPWNPVKSESNKRKKGSVGSFLKNSKAWSSVLERAEEVQANLSPEFPSFVKAMLHSHVAVGFWLGLPKSFCVSYLPKNDATIELEDISGQVYETKFLASKVGLSAGWRGFSIAHKLVEGDFCVFQLVTPSKFKVYIIRSKGSNEVDCALGLLKLEACIEQEDIGDIVVYENETRSLKLLPQVNSDEINQIHSSGVSNQSDNDSGDIRPEVSDGLKLADSVISFKEVKNIEDFNIVVNGLIINSQLSKYLLAKYYELCSSQKTFLHENLLEGLNCKLTAGIILETINIADAIRASKITTSKEDFVTWDKTLEGFEVFGMNVSFLRARLDQLIKLDSKLKYEQIRIERENAKEELRNLEAEIEEVKNNVIRLDAEFETVGENCEEQRLLFQKVARSPWR